MNGKGIPPGARRINPDEEAARLIIERNRRASILSWPVIVEEIQQIETGDDRGMIFVHLRVTAEKFSPVPADLGEKLAAALAENWPVSDDRL